MVLLVIIFIIALCCCNTCVYPEYNGIEMENGTVVEQFMFIDTSDVTIDGSFVCPVINCEPGGFLAKRTQMLYRISGADSCAVISDAFIKTDSDEYLFTGSLITDNPIEPISTLTGIKGGEILAVDVVEDGLTRIYNREAGVLSRFYVVPRGENQTFESWKDSCRVVGMKEGLMINSWAFSNFFSKGRSDWNLIGEHSKSDYEPEEYIAKLDKNAYKTNNSTPLQIIDVDVSYYENGTAANVSVTFEPVTDSLVCNFVCQVITEYDWARTDNNISWRNRRTIIEPGQTKYEFDFIAGNIGDPEQIADVALVAVAEGYDFQIAKYDGTYLDKIIIDLSIEEPKNDDVFYVDVMIDHRSSFWQKITLHRDLSAAWWKLIIVVILAGFLIGICLEHIETTRSKKLLLTIIILASVLIVSYIILWFVLVFF